MEQLIASAPFERMDRKTLSFGEKHRPFLEAALDRGSIDLSLYVA